MPSNNNNPLVHPIRKLSVENFGCLRSVEVDFEPFTVLVGPNDSGKTLIVRSLESLGIASRSGWDVVFQSADALQESTFLRSSVPIVFTINGTLLDTSYKYSVCLEGLAGHCSITNESLTFAQPDVPAKHLRFERDRTGSQRWWFADKYNGFENHYGQVPGASSPVVSSAGLRGLFTTGAPIGKFAGIEKPLEALRDLLSSIQLFRLDPKRLRADVPVNRAADGAVDADGFGLAGRVADLILAHRGVMDRLECGLRGAMPNVKHVHVGHNGPNYCLEVEMSSGARVKSGMVSDGVLLFLAYAILSEGPSSAKVLIVEEPEIGIHPGLLQRVVGLFKGLAAGEFGERVQVILTTHSPLLLNMVEPHEIRVLKRDADAGTSVVPFTNAPDIGRLLEYQGPGEIWVNMSEDYITRGEVGA